VACIGGEEWSDVRGGGGVGRRRADALSVCHGHRLRRRVELVRLGAWRCGRRDDLDTVAPSAGGRCGLAVGGVGGEEEEVANEEDGEEQSIEAVLVGAGADRAQRAHEVRTDRAADENVDGADARDERGALRALRDEARSEAAHDRTEDGHGGNDDHEHTGHVHGQTLAAPHMHGHKGEGATSGHAESTGHLVRRVGAERVDGVANYGTQHARD
jgi:hypothetical protein